jgi:hypothetical protein
MQPTVRSPWSVSVVKVRLLLLSVLLGAAAAALTAWIEMT